MGNAQLGQHHHPHLSTCGWRMDSTVLKNGAREICCFSALPPDLVDWTAARSERWCACGAELCPMSNCKRAALTRSAIPELALPTSARFVAITSTRRTIVHQPHVSPPLVIGNGSSAVSHWLSAVSHRPSAIGHRTPAIGHRSSAIGHRPSVIGQTGCRNFETTTCIHLNGTWGDLDGECTSTEYSKV